VRSGISRPPPEFAGELVAQLVSEFPLQARRRTVVNVPDRVFRQSAPPIAVFVVPARDNQRCYKMTWLPSSSAVIGKPLRSSHKKPSALFKRKLPPMRIVAMDGSRITILRVP